MASHGVDPDPVLQTLDAQPGRLAAALSRPALAEHVAAWMDALRALSLPITTGQLLAACPQLLAAPDSALAELPQRLGELERALGGRNALRDALLAAPELLLLSGAGGDAARRLQVRVCLPACLRGCCCEPAPNHGVQGRTKRLTLVLRAWFVRTDAGDELWQACAALCPAARAPPPVDRLGQPPAQQHAVGGWAGWLDGWARSLSLSPSLP